MWGEAVYPIMNLDVIVVKVRSGHVVVNRPAYIALAVDVERQKHVLGIWLCKGDEGAKFWLGILTKLKNRGGDRCAEPMVGPRPEILQGCDDGGRSPQ